MVRTADHAPIQRVPVEQPAMIGEAMQNLLEPGGEPIDVLGRRRADCPQLRLRTLLHGPSMNQGDVA
ncbi:MAG TPA: hypothetical protein EYP14_13950 [Planctomycetaceae bacterium]|nr:hypothetical protein [Planctomycetaceae bacterium]